VDKLKNMSDENGQEIGANAYDEDEDELKEMKRLLFRLNQ
jgi:hypothetical protein